MILDTKGIVLHAIKYSETSLIVHIYTEAFGLQSYLIKGVRQPNSRFRSGLFQPLTLLDMVVYHQEKSSLRQAKELKIAEPCYSITADIRKSSIALFLAELIYRSIKEEETNPALFSFIWHSILLLDASEKGLSGFHLLFTIKLSRYLGFFPQTNRTEVQRFFHLREGSFTPLFSDPEECLDESMSSWVHQLAGSDMDQFSLLSVPAAIRQPLLEKLLLYYHLHLPGMKRVRSHEILHTVLS